ncbi:MAG TPA: acyl-CoA dehydrogenase, partial [Hyphomonadaceae bacterium]|nr:acyl-CoA dehydrogenase [Hyphomonadaceae bacterium]
LVGRLNGGWEIAKRLLQYERSNISATGFGADRAGTPPLYERAKEYVGTDASGKLLDPDLRMRLADLAMDDKAFKLTVARMAEQSKAGEEVGHTASIVKYAAAKLNQKKTEMTVETLGYQGLGWEGEG